MYLLTALAFLFLSPTAQFSETGPTYTYDPDVVPVGAAAVAVAMESGNVPVELGRTRVGLAVDGLLPDRTYGAHVHTGECGADPAAAGPHTQNRPDPVQPSVDPAYANPVNEVWLDFTTNAQGDAVAIARVPWSLSAREARSVVLHAEGTHTEPGHAGTAGKRLACVPLESR
ncbi:superoxide dismutase family protein [Actinokineospora pegani]|uniref:superoxide dismutase family protein n=1 Tax=Actinokineospora pegani TaxID=2654637 RepID=UPI0012EB03CD|nr:superoxide dismutase family protein [Actinokineospora pegani]